MSKDQRLTVLAAAAVFVSILSLDARAEEQGRAKTSYPSLEDVPRMPDKPTMATEEQLKLKKELSAARDRQAIKGSRAGTPPAKP
jgi:hypothetical protein